MRQRFIGIDEAGYGPNLGPLVMVAVEALVDEEPIERSGFDLWARMPGVVTRAGGHPSSVWIDDSKRVYKPGGGLKRLDHAMACLLKTLGVPVPETYPSLLEAFGVGCDPSELCLWDEGEERAWPVVMPTSPAIGLEGPGWRISDVRVVLVGPTQFNLALDRLNNKAGVHFGAFTSLLQRSWERSNDGVPTSILGDKHGGRNFYGLPLSSALPGAKIVPVEESPDSSRYSLSDATHNVSIGFEPRADSGDGLVALASMVAKGIREHWMAVFNQYWARRVANLRPTAGYPVDAARFRAEIDPVAAELGHAPSTWWRSK